MKKSLPVLLTTALILGSTLATSVVTTHAAVTSPATTITQKQDNNLLMNGNFETGYAHWQDTIGGAGGIHVYYDQDEPYVTLSHPTNGSYAMLRQDVPASQLKTYDLTFMYKGSDNSFLTVNAVDPFGRYVPILETLLPSDSSDWITFKRTVVMPQDTAESTWNSLSTAFVAGGEEAPGSTTPLTIRNVSLVEVK